MNERPEVIQQGKAIVERDDEGLLIMLPDGQIEWARSKKGAEKLIKSFFKKHLGEGFKVGVGTVEWRI